jgi:hypothetical protein
MNKVRRKTKRKRTFRKMGYLVAGPEHNYVDKNGGTQKKLLHRVVAEEKLGRKLSSKEIVHHVDLNKDNNAPENLFVCSRSEHRLAHHSIELVAAELIKSGQMYFDQKTREYRLK